MADVLRLSPIDSNSWSTILNVSRSQEWTPGLVAPSLNHESMV